MLKLRTILLSSTPYYVILLLSLLVAFFRINLPLASCYDGTEKLIEGRLIKTKIDGNQLTMTIQAKEKINAYYYFSNKEEKETFSQYYHLGDTLQLEGNLRSIAKSTTPNIFSYQENQNRKGQFFQMQVESFQKVKDNQNILYGIKNWILQRTKQVPKTGMYLRAFLLGEKDDLNQTVMKSYQNNGISHLFAISGMHVSLLSGMLLSILKKVHIKEKPRYLFTMIILIFYLWLTNFSSSVLRAVLFFLLFSLNKIYYFHIKPLHLFYITFALTITYQPFFLYQVGFQFSFLISFFLILFADWINESHKKMMRALKVSCLSFCSSIPIALYHFSQINFLSVFYNLYFVPLVTIFVFPLSLIVFCFPFLDSIYYYLILLLEQSSLGLGNISFGTLIFIKPPVVICLLYIVVTIILFLFIMRKKYGYCFLYMGILVTHYCYPKFLSQEEMIVLDVGQGDSLLLRTKQKTILIDTGGKLNFNQEKWQQKQNISHVTNYVTIPFLKSLGISKIDYLFLTHGDYDHMGEAIFLLQNFKVEKIMINEGKQNELEQQVLKEAKKKRIPVEVCKQDSVYQIGNIMMQSLNRNWEEENDSSIVLFLSWFNRRMLLMGDATIQSEQAILSEYSLPKVDILKVGHHGSTTSTSDHFLKQIEPKVSLISAGKDNTFHHPHPTVVKRLQEYHSTIYVTKEKGTIRFDVKTGTFSFYPP